MPGIYNSDGRINVTKVNGLTYTGVYAPDGSLNVYDTTGGTSWAGAYHPCGAINVVLNNTFSPGGKTSPNGASVVLTSNLLNINGALSVFDVAGTLASKAMILIGNEVNGVSLDFTDLSIVVRDPVTPANNFTGSLIGKITNTAPPSRYVQGVDGLYTSGSNLRSSFIAGVNQGIMIEGASTNQVLFCRNLTNVAWLAVNVTPSLTATGIDGVANTATRLTATANLGTILQTIVSASATRITSAFVKRITGTGTLELTQDGVTFTTVATTSAYTRVSVPSATVLNPMVGFRLGTSGDVFDVDFIQEEQLSWVSSPILTTAVAVTRASDDLSLPTSLFNVASEHTLYTQGAIVGAINGTANNPFMALGSSGTDQSYLNNASSTTTANFTVTSGNVTQASLSSAAALSLNTFFKLGGRVRTNDFKQATNAILSAVDSTGVLPASTTNLTFGKLTSAVVPTTIFIKQNLYVGRGFSDAELQTLTT